MTITKINGKRVFVFVAAFLVLLVGAASLYSTLCKTESYYDARSWTWSYDGNGSCTYFYNCLGHATGSRYWEWPWGATDPSSSQMTTYLQSKGYTTNSNYTPAIISHGYSWKIKHVSKVTGGSTCDAKWGALNLLDHGSWNPYYTDSESYGAKVKVYYKAYFYVDISGPVTGNNRGTYTWCANISGYNGQPPYSYDWRYSYDGSSYVNSFGATQCRTAQLPQDMDLYLKVTVTDSAGNYTIDYFHTTNTDAFMSGIKLSRGAEISEKLTQYMFEVKFANMSKKDGKFNPVMLSSNPYDYIDNEGFRKIVAIGPEALVSIREKLSTSGANGLEEYILAIAAEEIAKVDFKSRSIDWATGKEWLKRWDIHLRDLPVTVNSIFQSGDSIAAKNAALTALGIPAIPFIKDKIERGNNDYIPAFKALLKGYGPSFQQVAGVSDLDILPDENKKTLQFLKDLVEAYRK
jgi:hypothetical protein